MSKNPREAFLVAASDCVHRGFQLSRPCIDYLPKVTKPGDGNEQPFRGDVANTLYLKIVRSLQSKRRSKGFRALIFADARICCSVARTFSLFYQSFRGFR